MYFNQEVVISIRSNSHEHRLSQNFRRSDNFSTTKVTRETFTYPLR